MATVDSPTEVKVLLIEDDRDYAELVVLKLSNSDFAPFQVECVGSLAEFKQKIRQSKPDIILSDLGLSDSIGLETFKQVLATAGDIPIVVLTGDSDAQAGREAVRLGAQDYLVKIAVRGELLVHGILHAIERNRLKIELKQANERLAVLSMTDPLTGLLNRRGLEQALAREASFKKRYGANFYVVMVDLDDFKSINEGFGHAIGDLALQHVADCIKAKIRPTDYAARIGGDEFLVLLVQARQDGVVKVADRIRKAIGKQWIPVGGHKPIHTTASAGLVDLNDDDIRLDHIIQKAGVLLKQSKVSGKNRTTTTQG